MDNTIQSHPALLINEQASSDDYLEAITVILGEAGALLVILNCSLDSEIGPPSPEIVSTTFSAIEGQLELLGCYCAALHG